MTDYPKREPQEPGHFELLGLQSLGAQHVSVSLCVSVCVCVCVCACVSVSIARRM